MGGCGVVGWGVGAGGGLGSSLVVPALGGTTASQPQGLGAAQQAGQCPQQAQLRPTAASEATQAGLGVVVTFSQGSCSSAVALGTRRAKVGLGSSSAGLTARHWQGCGATAAWLEQESRVRGLA